MSSDTKDCPYWRGGYCVADTGCRLHHDAAKGGHLQETYLAQLKQQQEAPVATSRPLAQAATPYPAGAYSASAMASALYGGGQPVVFGYGYYGQMMPMAPAAHLGPPRNYKTIQCRHYVRGHCMRGDSCGFRHGEEPVTGPSASFGQLPAELANPVHPGRPFRVVTCRRWVQGTCTHGDRCTFRHDFDAAANSEHTTEYVRHPDVAPRRDDPALRLETGSYTEAMPERVRLETGDAMPENQPDNVIGVKRALSPTKSTPVSATEDQTSKVLKLSPSDAQ